MKIFSTRRNLKGEDFWFSKTFCRREISIVSTVEFLWIDNIDLISARIIIHFHFRWCLSVGNSHIQLIKLKISSCLCISAYLQCSGPGYTPQVNGKNGALIITQYKIRMLTPLKWKFLDKIQKRWRSFDYEYCLHFWSKLVIDRSIMKWVHQNSIQGFL